MKNSRAKKNYGSISRKLSVMIFIMFGISSLLMVLLTCFTSVSKIITEKKDYYLSTAESKVIEMKSWFDKQVRTVDTIAAAVNNGKYDTDNFSKAEEYLVSLLPIEPGVYCYYMGRPDKSSVFSDGWDAAADNYDPTSRDWYKRAVAENKTVVSDPYIDVNTKQIVITVSKPIYNGDKLTAVLAADIFVTSVVDIANQSKMDNAYPILVDSTGNIVVHKNEEFLPTVDENENEKFTNVSEINLSGYDASADAVIYNAKDYDGTDSIFAQQSLSDYGWNFLYSTNNFEFFKSELIMIASYLIAMVVLLIAVTVILAFTIKKKLAPLGELKTASEAMKNGVLSYKASYRRDDEIGATCIAIEEANTNILSYVHDIDEKLQLMADGKFNNEITIDYIGDFSQIKNSIIVIQNSLHTILSDIDKASNLVSNGSDRLSDGARKLTDGAVMQASAIDELTSTFESVAARVNITAENAQLANNIVSDMGGKVNECNSSMKQLTDAMQNIGNMSNEIKKIIQTVEDIAFQTNILALNASVEAARAGEAGKGFAVVADEVRNLAGKTAEAATLTTQLIEQSVIAIANGTQLTDSTAEELISLVDNASKAVDLVKSIALAAEKENVELSQITQGIEQISGVVQSNTATAEESAASSDELNSQVAVLKSLTDKFEL